MKSQKGSIARIGGIVFNLADPDQRKMHDHVKTRTNFSAYMKRLIQRDMDSMTAPLITRVMEPISSLEGLDDDTANSFI